MFLILDGFRPIPGVDYVENYIKAYYLPESSMEQWVKERKEYSVKHVMNLLTVSVHLSKRMRQKLIASLEEQNLVKNYSPIVSH